MRSLVLMCALAICVMWVCKPSRRFEVATEAPLPQSELTSEPAAAATTVTKPTLLSLLTLGAAIVGAVSSTAAESPLDANARLATHIVETTAQLEASAARVADHRVH
jgi:hypothetical protein